MKPCLNAKQREKEYKLTLKDIKSKDFNNRFTAIEKFSADLRYVIEGNGLYPWLLSLAPKKKTLEYVAKATQSLVDFLSISISEHYNEHPTIAGLKELSKIDSGLDSLKILFELLSYKEEQKNPKKIKKNEASEPIEPTSEELTILRLHEIGNKAVYKLAMTFYSQSSDELSFKGLIDKFYNLDGFIVSICDVLKSVRYTITSADTSENEMEKSVKNEVVINEVNKQQAIYALFTLKSLLKYSSKSVSYMIDDHLNSDLSMVGIVRELASSPYFSLICIQIIELLIQDNRYLNNVVESDHFFLQMTGLLMDASGTIFDLDSPIPTTTIVGKGTKEIKKAEEKPKKGAPPAAPASEEPKHPDELLDRFNYDPKRSAAARMKLICKVFIRIAGHENSNKIIEENGAKKIVYCCAKLLLSSTIWKISGEPLDHPLDVTIADILHTISVMIGTFGLISPTIRRYVCESGGLTGLCKLLLQSKSIIASTTTDQGANVHVDNSSSKDIHRNKASFDLNTLRMILEKAIFSLICDTVKNEELNLGTLRWKSNTQYSVDLVTLMSKDTTGILDSTERNALATAAANAPKGKANAAVPTPTEPPTFISYMIDMITALATDIELSSRGVRLLASIILSNLDSLPLENVAEFFDSTKIDVITTPKLCSLVEFLIQAFLRELEERRSAIANANDVTPTVINSLSSGKECLCPKSDETIYLIFSTLEVFFKRSNESSQHCIKLFASNESQVTKDRIGLLSKLLYSCGPVGSKLNDEEYTVNLYDPRAYAWSLNPIILEMKGTEELRPLVLDLLSLVAASAKRFRKYEGINNETGIPEPALPCESPVLPTISPCEESSLLVCKLCAEACCSVILSQSRFQLSAKNIPQFDPITSSPSKDSKSTINSTWTVVPSEIKMSLDVLDAALRFMNNIFGIGAVGTVGVIEAIAAKGFEQFAAQSKGLPPFPNEFALNSLLEALSPLQNEPTSLNSLHSQLPEGFVWSRSKYFNDIFDDSNQNESFFTVDMLIKQPTLWPYITLSGALLGILCNPKYSSVTVNLALVATKSMLQETSLRDHSQTVVNDILAATFLGLGGSIPLCAVGGKFGNLTDENKFSAIELTNYLFQRGACREMFWSKWAIDHKVEIAIDPKTGKPIPPPKGAKVDVAKEKKDTKKDKNAPPATNPIIAEIALNLESTETIPDPNRGPSKKFWTSILNTASYDLHGQATYTSALTAAITGLNEESALLLIQLGVELNCYDCYGMTPLMNGIALQQSTIVQKLIENGAAINALNAIDGNPVIKYSLMSMQEQDIKDTFVGHLKSKNMDLIELSGCSGLLDILLDASEMDLEVTDSEGNSVLMSAMGFGSTSITIGGYRIQLKCKPYADSNITTTEKRQILIEKLILKGVDVNACNQNGIVPLHAVAAMGDEKLISLLFNSGAIANAVDQSGYLPIHYTAACCPQGIPDENNLKFHPQSAFQLLMSNSIFKPLHIMNFQNHRNGKSIQEKNIIDLEKACHDAFSAAFCPAIIVEKRLDYEELLYKTSTLQTNLLQLCMAGDVIFKSDPLRSHLLTQFNKESRIELALYFIECAVKSSGYVFKLTSNIDQNGLTVVHAMSLLLQGTTKQTPLTEKEKRSKREKFYTSKEMKLVDCILSSPGNDIQLTCSQDVKELKMDNNPWTVLHAAICWCNSNFVEVLIQDKGFDISQDLYLHFFANTPTMGESLDDSIRIARLLVDAASKSLSYKTLLNASDMKYGARPLHLAVRQRKAVLVEELCKCIKVDLNAIDEQSGLTAYHEVCVNIATDVTNQSTWIKLLRSFQDGRDRIDLLVHSKQTDGSVPFGDTCIDTILSSMNVDALGELILLRKNDVIEQLLTSRKADRLSSDEANDEDKQYNWLQKLELDHLRLAKLFNVVPLEDVVAVEVTEVKEMTGNDEDIEDGEGVEEQKDDAAMDEIDEDKEEEPIPIATIEPIQLVVMSEEEKAKVLPLFTTTSSVLRVVLDLVMDCGVVDESIHVHNIFREGKLLTV